MISPESARGHPDVILDSGERGVSVVTTAEIPFLSLPAMPRGVPIQVAS